MIRAMIVAALVAATSVLPARAERVVATTGWVAAFVRTAGYTGPIRVLAPYELRHPPEYELKPSDVVALSGAELVVYAGYERMAPRVVEASGASGAKTLRVGTDHGLATIRESVLAIAAALGTDAASRENLRALEALYEDWRRELAASGLAGARVIAHVMHRPLLEELGFRVAAVFGPGPLEAAKIGELSSLGVRLLADNLHNPVAGPLRETIGGLRSVVLRNFPAAEMSILELLAENRRLMAAAWESKAP